MYNPLLERLDKEVLLADGAMGTNLFSQGFPYTVCYEELNVSRPDIISDIHRSYIAAGAGIIETNTFGANRYRLGKHGFEGRVREFNLKAARLAREAVEISGEPVLVAGSVGPLGQPRGGASWQPDGMRAAFREQIEALMEGGVNFILLETFYDYQQMVHALSVAKAITDLPVVAQMTFSEEGHTFSGHTPAEVLAMLKLRGADVIGLNCHVGPQGSMSVLEQLAEAQPTFPYLSVMPNAGAPERVEGRIFYHATPDYFASYVPRFVEAGARILGGCCGTTPEHIAAMRKALDNLQTGSERSKTFQPGAGTLMFSPPHGGTSEGAAVERVIEKATGLVPTQIAQKLARGEFVVSIEMLPPRGINPTKMLQAASAMAELGADAVNITDSAMARVRMGSMGCAMLVQQSVGLEAIIHYTSRDRNLMALQSDLLGAHANGIRNVLALTGDPPRLGDYPGASGIWDVDAIGLIGILKRLNEGQDWNGTKIGTAANFHIGAAFNPTATDLPTEIERLRRKLAAGADFIMTQPVFDPAILRETLEQVGQIKVPILAGIMLLHNYKHAEYMRHEVPGIVVPEAVVGRMHEAGEKGMTEGLKIATEILTDIHGLIQGVYIMPSHGKYEASGELLKLLKS